MTSYAKHFRKYRNNLSSNKDNLSPRMVFILRKPYKTRKTIHFYHNSTEKNQKTKFTAPDFDLFAFAYIKNIHASINPLNKTSNMETKRAIKWGFVLLAGFFVGCSDETGDDNSITAKEREDIPLSTKSEAVNAQANHFAFDFMQAYAGQRESEINYCISPLGVTSVLGMLLNGADGETYTQIQRAMGFDDFTNEEINQYMQTMQQSLRDVDNTTTYLNANSMWAKEGISFLPAYVETNQTYYDAETRGEQPFDQTTVNAINNWCSDKTKGHITEFIHPGELGKLSVLLLNAIYFKGIWTSPFKESDTKERTFTLADGTEKQVPMMYQEEHFNCEVNDEVTLVRLPYGNEAFRMSVFFPTDEQGSIDELLQNLTPEKWASWEERVSYPIKLYLPRFTFNTEDEKLIQLLEEVGIRDAFGGTADFSNMTDSSLAINLFKQITTVEVNEEGTVATAVTGAGMYATSNEPIIPKPTVIEFNRPFGFIISETSTGAILFAGKVGDPTAK